MRSEKLTLFGAPGIDFNMLFGKRIQQISSTSHRYVLHDKESEVFQAKFSPDQSYMAASYGDGTIMIYSSFHGDRLYTVKDEEISYPITALSWKPTASQSSDG